MNTLLALYTDGLVEAPGQETDVTTAGLAHTDESDLDQLIDNLVHHSWPQGWHTRVTGTPGGTPRRLRR